jgi:hypothetical protein
MAQGIFSKMAGREILHREKEAIMRLGLQRKEKEGDGHGV